MSIMLRKLFSRLQAPEGDEGSAGGGDTGGAESESGSFDMAAGLDSIASDLFGSSGDHEEADDIGDDPARNDAAPAVEEQAASPAIEAKKPPQSWAKEKHEVWSKLDPAAQEYIELREKQMLDGLTSSGEDAKYGRTLKEVIQPYMPLIKQQGLDPAKAIGHLLNAHHTLTNTSPDQKAAYLVKLAQSYGIDIAKAAESATKQQTADPALRALQEKVEQLQGTLTQGQQAAMEARRGQVAKEVESFASDPSHAYFDEVSDDIVALIHAGHSLQDAYEKAVWANPVTRQKELARLTAENEAKFKEAAKAKVEAASKARSTNVNGRDTQRAPTAPKGSMEDTMRETLKAINTRH